MSSLQGGLPISSHHSTIPVAWITEPATEPQLEFLKIDTIHNIIFNQESVAGSVIQATGIVEFEDGLWRGNHLKARNGLQRVRTIPGV